VQIFSSFSPNKETLSPLGIAHSSQFHKSQSGMDWWNLSFYPCGQTQETGLHRQKKPQSVENLSTSATYWTF
jgi:hypothetical protein